jgi:hypothetical protein
MNEIPVLSLESRVAARFQILADTYMKGEKVFLLNLNPGDHFLWSPYKFEDFPFVYVWVMDAVQINGWNLCVEQGGSLPIRCISPRALVVLYKEGT